MSIVDCAFSPGLPSWTISGTTISIPVKHVLSPGFAYSTISPLRMTSTDRGMDPGGISEECSCKRTFYQSWNTLSLATRSNSTWFEHCELLHFIGFVNLNCCSMPSERVSHILQRKVPIESSGLTSVVLVTVPSIDMILPRFAVFRSLTLSTFGKL